MGCENLAYAYTLGLGGPVDASVVRNTYEQACRLGAKDACSAPAAAAKARARAKTKELEQLCDAGQPYSCGALAMLYERGWFTASSAARAGSLNARACKLGVKQACR
jgi:TPR repeat protein